MFMEQLSQFLSVQGQIDPVSQGAGSVNSPSVDLQKFKRAIFVLDVGVFGGSATVDMKLQFSPDNSTWTDIGSLVPATFGTGTITQLLAAGGNNRVACLECRADQLAAMITPAKARYVRVVVTVGTAATLISVLCLGADSPQHPGSQFDATSVAQKQIFSGPT